MDQVRLLSKRQWFKDVFRFMLPTLAHKLTQLPIDTGFSLSLRRDLSHLRDSPTECHPIFVTVFCVKVSKSSSNNSKQSLFLHQAFRPFLIAVSVIYEAKKSKFKLIEAVAPC